jgi:predicted metal-binding protein
MTSKTKLEEMFRKSGFTDFRWLDPKSIVTAQWVRMKCRFGCGEYGQTATCPPNTPSVEECERFFREYKRAVIFHFAKSVARPEDRHPWSRGVNLKLVKLEREIFLAGNVKAFLLAMDSCAICDECVADPAACKKPRLARPSAESMAIDVYSTVLKAGYPIEVLSSYKQVMNRYAILLID